MMRRKDKVWLVLAVAGCVAAGAVLRHAPQSAADGPAAESLPLSVAQRCHAAPALPEAGPVSAEPLATRLFEDRKAPHERIQHVVYGPDGEWREVRLCQFCPPPARYLNGIDGQSCRPPGGEPGWGNARPIPWEQFGQGEYLGPPRSPHVLEYRLRVNDVLELVYRFTHEEITGAYRLVVGDEIAVESYSEDADLAIRRGDINLGRGLTVQPDGTINLPLIGSVHVVGRTLKEVEELLEDRAVLLINPRFTVTPIKTNTKLEDLRSAVDARYGAGGQTRTAVVSPDGTVQLVGLGSIPAQGLTMEELQGEINARYVELVGRGVEVTVTLREYAPRFVWVVGEVNQPGQYSLNQPVTVVQALALAQGFVNGGNVREIVVFRRDDNWQLMATRLDVRGVFVGSAPYPSDNIWLRDNDVVVVPKMPILRLNEFIDLVFTRGIYGVVPFSGVSVNISNQTTL